MRALLCVLLLAGCTNVTNVYLAPDGGETDMAGVTNSPDLAGVEPSDLAGADLRQLPADLKPAPPPDLMNYPGCGGPGLPTGASCQNNPQCCHGLCSSATNMPPYVCCFAKNTNCMGNSDCCSGVCGAGKICL